MNKATFALTAIAAVTFAQNVSAFQKGDWVIRAGFASVVPDESSSNIVVGSDLGVNVGVESNTQLALNLAYFITDKVNVEVLAATPFKHDVNFGVSDPLGTGDQLGEVTHLPPTVTVNYFFADSASKFQPYVGAGLNYTLFFDEDFTSANQSAGLSDLSLDNSFGIAAQIGADYMFSDEWFLNGSIRWIDIDTEASFQLGGAAGSVDSIEIDPWVYSITIGYRF
ncbi:OmpW family outer membrane protein [Aestuariibacter salexigens]|uniref:OmpW family outer membrane protein n=1 Tax=Aestuariibacter salexigens TaxID=226010 RepID=UPI00040D6086|nr:OmpW family outer membrane protein [Aestuariibacter salexigens]